MVETHGEPSRVKKEFKCGSCTMVYRSKQALMSHHKKEHEDEGHQEGPDDVKPEIPTSYMCELCGVISETQIEYQVHMHSHSGNVASLLG